MNPTISIVVVCYNDRKKLGDCLHSLLEQTYPESSREIIVVDDGSTDGTAEYVRSAFPEVRVIEKENSGADNSRMHGVRAARGGVIAFIDSDCIAFTDWLEKISTGLHRNQSVIIGGRILHRGNFLTRMVGVSSFGEFQGSHLKEVANIPTCNMGIKKEVFKRFSFHPGLRFSGDALFCSQLRMNGHRLVYDPDIKVMHRPATRFISLMKRAHSYAEGYIFIRRIEPGMNYSRIIRYPIPGIVLTTFGRALLDWYRLFRYRKNISIEIYEILPSLIFLLMIRMASIFGAVKGYKASVVSMRAKTGLKRPEYANTSHER